ncbi:MAG: carboxylesterase/lipase family protein [Alcanivorax nanhaiticus]
MTAVIRQGHYEGLHNKGVIEYRGIPFAMPPLGERRFKSPQPLPDSDEACRADQFPLASLQMNNPIMGVNESSQDCLYLNIWRPQGEGPFPVMVWFHGGGYLSGSISQVLYNGAELARSQGVVVVNAAYRLGALGFADFSALAPELEAVTNAGLRDQVAALEWVAENIAAFAGDPESVTIFGESAGGFSVCSLLACPAATDLFHAAIVQSGAADFALSPEEAGKVAEAMVAALPGDGHAAARLLNCSDKDWIRAQNASVKVLVDRGLRKTTPQFAMNFLPVVDGDFLPELPIEAIARGAAADKRLLAGVCADEYHFFQYGGVLAGKTSMEALREIGDDELLRRFERGLPGHGAEADRYYRETVTPDPGRCDLDRLSAMESDRLFRVPTLRLLDSHSAHNNDCWGFQFTWPSAPFGLPLGACHVVDIPFVFGVTDTPAGVYFTGGGEEAKALSERVMSVWGQFAHGNELDWPRWQDTRQVCQFGPGEPFAALLDEAGEALWETIIPLPTSAG